MQEACRLINADPGRDRAAVGAHLDVGLLPAGSGRTAKIGAVVGQTPGERLGIGQQDEPVTVDRGAAEQLLGADDDFIGGGAGLDDVAGTSVVILH